MIDWTTKETEDLLLEFYKQLEADGWGDIDTEWIRLAGEGLPPGEAEETDYEAASSLFKAMHRAIAITLTLWAKE